MKHVLLFLGIFCGTLLQAQTTAIPDVNFEQELVTQGIDSDGLVNGVILTSDAASQTSLIVTNKNISDLTGIQAFTALTSLNCSINNLTTLDISNNLSLEMLFVYENKLTSLDLRNHTALKTVYCDNNQLTSLNIAGLTVLEDLNAKVNNLTGINTATNTALRYFDCAENQIAALGLSSNLNLTVLDCYDNQLTGTLDLSIFSQLESCNASENMLTSLLVGNTASLTFIDCSDNQLGSLNVSTLPNLDEFICRNAQLTSLNVANGNNTNFISFNSIGNPNLSCIQVDDPNYSNSATASWQKDLTSTYAVNCGAVGIAEPNRGTLGIKLFPNPVVDVLQLSSTDGLRHLRFEIVSLDGRVEMAGSLRQAEIDVTGLAPGAYILRLQKVKPGSTDVIASQRMLFTRI